MDIQKFAVPAAEAAVGGVVGGVVLKKVHEAMDKSVEKHNKNEKDPKKHKKKMDRKIAPFGLIALGFGMFFAKNEHADAIGFGLIGAGANAIGKELTKDKKEDKKEDKKDDKPANTNYYLGGGDEQHDEYEDEDIELEDNVGSYHGSDIGWEGSAYS